MTKDQEERLVVSWEGIAREIGEFNATLKQAIGKQWPEPRERRDAVISKLPTEEDKLKKETGNTDGPVAEWLSEFDDEQGGSRSKRKGMARSPQRNRTTKTSCPSQSLSQSQWIGHNKHLSG